MGPFDIAIHGSGLLPGLLAVHLLDQEPGATMLLLCADGTVGGDQVEPVVVGQLSAAARSLAGPFAVAHWPGYYEARGGVVQRIDEEVWLLDPVQVWLELIEREDRCTAQTNCPAAEQAGSALSWNGETAQVERFIDLSPLTAQRYESEIMGIEAVRQLDLPILADYDTADDGWEATQLLPLGDERVLMRKLPRRESLIAVGSTFESLLSALVAP